VLSARTFVSDNTAVASVFAMSLSDRRCTVHRGTLIGEAEAASLEDATELSGPKDAKQSEDAATETRTLAASFAAGREQLSEAGRHMEMLADVGLTVTRKPM
jgi:hypothetical protein